MRRTWWQYRSEEPVARLCEIAIVASFSIIRFPLHTSDQCVGQFCIFIPFKLNLKHWNRFEVCYNPQPDLSVSVDARTRRVWGVPMCKYGKQAQLLPEKISVDSEGKSPARKKPRPSNGTHLRYHASSGRSSVGSIHQRRHGQVSAPLWQLPKQPMR